MSESEGKAELSGIARSVDELFEVAGLAARSTKAPGLEKDGSGATGSEGVEAPTDEDAVEPAAEATASGEDGSGATTSEDAETLTDADAPEPAADAPSESPAAPTEAHEEADSRADAREPVAGRLDSTVEAYIEGDAGRAAEIRALAEEALQDREVEPVARVVQRLASAAGEPPDPAFHELVVVLASPVVLERIVHRFGNERDPDVLQEYHVASRVIGEPMAKAIREELADSTDEGARRVHCDALASMGSASRALIEEMVFDENRFLARDAVSILGEMGGAKALGLVTAALANPDARVRREALRAMGKLADPGSAPRVVAMFDDSDATVRATAAVVAGQLKVERALRHIVGMLDAAKSPDEILPLLEALGRIGDPGAVPAIEKHAVRSLLSRSPAEVRIAAYRALHTIGTPHAKDLLAQAAEDKDVEISTAVQEMLGEG